MGSIGVVAQVPNVHRLLKKHDVDVEVITAGEHKRTLTVLGENTDEAREKFTEQLEDVHKLFQEHVVAHREATRHQTAVATGESLVRSARAIELKLVDRLVTSDSYLVEQAGGQATCICLRWDEQKKPLERLLGGVQRVHGAQTCSVLLCPDMPAEPIPCGVLRQNQLQSTEQEQRGKPMSELSRLFRSRSNEDKSFTRSVE